MLALSRLGVVRSALGGLVTGKRDAKKGLEIYSIAGLEAAFYWHNYNLAKIYIGLGRNRKANVSFKRRFIAIQPRKILFFSTFLGFCDFSWTGTRSNFFFRIIFLSRIITLFFKPPALAHGNRLSIGYLQWVSTNFGEEFKKDF